MHDPERMVRSVERAFDILEVLKDRDGARITEIVEDTGYVASTVHRHLATLRESGYVLQEGKTYYLSLRFLDFGEYVRTRRKAYRLTKPKVEELAEATNERCQFVVEEGGQAVYVHVAVGRNAVETDSRVGSRLYLHATSVGKAILAHLPEHRVREILDQHGLPPLTEQTITDESALFEELEKVRSTGIAFNREGNILGLRSVGTPVFGADGAVIGALSVSGPTHRMKGARFEEEIPNLLLGASNELELKLKYS